VRLSAPLTAFLTVGISVLFSGCYLFPKEEQILAPPLIPPTEVSYDLIEVEQGVIEDKITATGSFVAVDQTNHYFRHRGGRLRSIDVSYGDQVSTGQVIAELDTESLESEIAQQELALAKARLVYEKLESSFSSGRELKLAQLDLELARLDLEDVERELEETRLIYSIDEKNAEVRARLQDLESGRRRRLVALQKAEISVDALRDGRQARYELRLAQADVDRAKLKLTDLKRELEGARLRAELNGEVTYINSRVSEGDYVAAYQTLVTLANPRDLRLQYSGFNTSDFLMGMAVDVEIDEVGYSGRVIMTPATVPFDAPENMKDKVHFLVDSLPSEVEMGDYASLSVTLARKEDVIVLPRRVVRSYLGRRYVQILEDGLVKERDVQTGLETPTEVEIVRGLELGQQVIIR
jgi:multidrug efflux pump subunit AcrA (membrane-fusion protein)